MLAKLLHWVWPIGMLALGVYFLAGSVMSLIWGGMIGVGAFVLGVRVWSKVSDDFKARTEALFKAATKEVAPSTPGVVEKP